MISSRQSVLVLHGPRHERWERWDTMRNPPCQRLPDSRCGTLAAMSSASAVITGIVAALHVYFLVLEMFLWATPFRARPFVRPLEEMRQTRTLAATPGPYNGFLAARLVWSLRAGAQPGP